MMEYFLYLIGMMVMILTLNLNLMLFFFQNLLFLLSFMFMLKMINIKFILEWEFLYGDYGFDKISMLLIYLSFWILSLMFLSVLNLMNYYLKIFSFQIIFLMLLLFGFFCSMDMMSFYLFFEVSLIPILIMILGWGGHPERLQAGLYLLMYTLFASLPFLLMLIIYMNNIGTLNLLIYYIDKIEIKINFYLYFFMMFVFLVKLPMYFIHLWLPKAHVEAPIFGSMVLAGVLLKMGSYGMLRVFLMMLNLCKVFNLFFIVISLVGSLIISMICMRQIDLKMLIAYSSVVHMGIMLCGMFSLYYWGIMGSLFMMVGHGLCSSGLFCLLNFNYKRINSRSLLFNKGLMTYYSKMSMWWFMFCIMNMAAPPSLNLIAEIYLIISMVKFEYLMILFIFMLSMFSGIYSIYLFSFTQHGFSLILNKYMNNNVDEFLLMILHWLPMNLFILNMSFFI